MNVNGTGYTVVFATIVSVVCALVVAVAAMALQPRQQANARLYMQKNVLLAAGLVEPSDEVSEAELRRLFDARIRMRLVDLASGEAVDAPDDEVAGFDQRRARNDAAQSRPAPANDAGIQRLPNRALVYFVLKDRDVDEVVLAIEGLGMWGTVYGFLALDRDGNTVRGLTYYDQKETPGLGGEIANPKWQALWRGRKVYDAGFEPAIRVIKGQAGPPAVDPSRVDGLSGATVTSNAVSRLTRFWLSDAGYGPFLRRFRGQPSG